MTSTITASFSWTCACGARIARGEAHYCSFTALHSEPVKPMLSLFEGGRSVDAGQNSEMVE